MPATLISLCDSRVGSHIRNHYYILCLMHFHVYYAQHYAVMIGTTYSTITLALFPIYLFHNVIALIALHSFSFLDVKTFLYSYIIFNKSSLHNNTELKVHFIVLLVYSSEDVDSYMYMHSYNFQFMSKGL